MSGGSYDYAQYKLAAIAATLTNRHSDAPHVLALAKHFKALGEVMGQIEWADSGDTSWTPDLDDAIRALLTPGAELLVATERAQRAASDLAVLLARAPLEKRSSAGSGTHPTEREANG